MIRDDLVASLRTALIALELDGAADATIELERPARREHGDWSSNVALATAKAAGRNPRELAAEIVGKLEAAPNDHVAAIEIAGPGFVNFRLSDSWLHDVLRSAVVEQENFGRSTAANGSHINVEFVSANPNKPLHAGHGRGASYGDSIARLLEAVGHRVTRESYLNDRGVQMDLFAASLAARKRGEDVPDDGYQGDYLIEWAAEMPDDADPLTWGYARALQSHKDTLAVLQIEHDVWFSEKSLVADGKVDASLAVLQEREMVFEEGGATWLRSTEYGDDKDRVLIKSDGDYTYLTPDIAYHRDKFERSDRLINVWGADHHGYVQRMKAGVGTLGHDPDDLEVIITQLVDFNRDGEPVRMSGRLGDMVALDDVIDEVGPDAARFTYLSQSMDTRQTFDLAALAEKSMDNPVYYVQYAHARIHSLVGKAAEAGIERAPLAATNLQVLTDDRELEILRVLSEYTDIVALAARERAPHKIITWLRELASAFHGFYHDCYVMGDGVTADQTQARLWLVEAARVGVVNALGLVGVSAPESM